MTFKQMPLLSVIVPVYNESRTITEILSKINSVNIDKEIIVVDDGSSDGTEKILRNIKYDNLKIVYHTSNRGKGAAFLTGLANASGEFVIIQDADLEYDPNDYLKLMDAIKKDRADIVMGARFMKGYHGLFARRLGNRFLAGVRNTISALNLKAQSFTIETEIAAKARKKGLRIAEIPISYYPRNYSEGKKIRWMDGISEANKMQKAIRYLDYVIYWSIVLIPFSMAISAAPMNVFMGFLAAAFLAKKFLKREPLFAKTAINIALLFLFAITCLSLLNSINLRDSFKGGIGRLSQYILIFFAIVDGIKDRKHINKIIISMLGGIILICADGIWQVAAGYDFIRGYKPVINIGLIRATASFKDSNVLGIYLSAIAPLIFGLTLDYFMVKESIKVTTENRRRLSQSDFLEGIKRIAFICVSVLALAGIALTYSRPTLLAVYIALFFLGIVKKKRVLIGSLLILTLVSPFILPKSVKNWAKEVEYNPLRFMCNDDRIAVYRNSLRMIKAHPFIGVGANTYMKNYKQYKESPEYRNIVTLDYMYAHNMYLHMAAEIGLIGLGIFFWLLYKLFAGTANIYRSLDERYVKAISLSLAACIIAFLINGLTESSLYYSRIALIFWYLTGFSLALKKFANADKAAAN